MSESESEADFLTWIMDLLRLKGWRFCHFRTAIDPRRAGAWRTAIDGDKGFPDIVAVRGERLLFVELKSDKGVLSAEQRVWLAALGRAGVERHCWRPRDRSAVLEALT